MKKEKLSYRDCGCLSDSYEKCVHDIYPCPNGCQYNSKSRCNQCPDWENLPNCPKTMLTLKQKLEKLLKLVSGMRTFDSGSERKKQEEITDLQAMLDDLTD